MRGFPTNYLDKDISFEGNGVQFGFRPAGSALNQGRVLLQQSDSTPSGRFLVEELSC